VVTHDLAVTFTDDQINAQIQLGRTQNGVDKGHSIATSEQEQTAAHKRSADASGLTPERKAAVQPDGQVASQQTAEVFVDCGAARFNFDEKNDLNYFIRTITPRGEQRIYWGKDLPRALEEAEAKVGESITATRVASKPVTVQEIQEQPDGSRQTVKVDANTVRTIERAFGRDSDGRKTLVQVTEEEKRILPGGEVKVMRTTSNPDANGGLQVVQRETQDIRQINPNVQETKTTFLTSSTNGGLAASMQTTERQTKTGEHDVEFRKSTLLPDLNGGWQVGEIREGTVKGDGQDRTKEERVLRPGANGNLTVVERTVSRESENAAGEKRATVETYSNNLPGSPVDDSLRLNQQVTTVSRTGKDGMQSSEKQVAERNPGQPSDSPRVTEQAIDIVRPGLGGTIRQTQTLRSLDSNGGLGVVSVDTRKQDSAPAIQVDIAPAKTSKASPSH